MTAAALPDSMRSASLAESALKGAARLWFLTAVAGQWVFVWYITAFYYGPTLQGRFQAWNRRDLITGYVPGDTAGNLYFAAHVLIAALITASGALQLFPQIRARAIAFHRWNGRVYILAAFVMALGGLWMVWVRGTWLNLWSAASSTLLAISIIGCAAMTLREALARRIDRHHRWALRTFLVVNGVWFQRVGYMFWALAAQGAGEGRRMGGLFDILLGFGEFVVPLAILELYLRARARGGPGEKAAVSALLLVSTAVTAVGIVGAYLIMWRPFL